MTAQFVFQIPFIVALVLRNLEVIESKSINVCNPRISIASILCRRL